jgi:hypothetical protein
MVLELDLAAIRLLVRPPRAQSDQRDNDERQQAARNTGVQTRSVARFVLESNWISMPDLQRC